MDDRSGSGGGGSGFLPSTPAGLEALYAACLDLYPDQPNPLQVTAVVKYWLGGPDPLDYISMYSNPGDAAAAIPPHWHYVSFGLSDLHGDGRVHDISAEDPASGFGFELTFRLKREPQDTAPPTWPATVMQSLAKYVFQSENVLCNGDHVSWHRPLDGGESRIQHMLATEDPQLKPIETAFGQVNFVQIVGICSEELRAVQHWNGVGLLELLKSVPGAGGRWAVTDMRRGETIFEIEPQTREAVERGIELEGSNLSGVSARCAWTARSTKKTGGHDESCDVRDVAASDEEPELREISETDSERIKMALKEGLRNSKPSLPCAGSDTKSASDGDDGEAGELACARSFDGIHLTFNLEAGTLLPLALRGRLKHGRHFTFKSVTGNVAITFVPPNVTGAIVDRERPFAARGPWLQVLLSEDKVDDVLEALLTLNGEDVTFPKTFSWPDCGLVVTILDDG